MPELLKVADLKTYYPIKKGVFSRTVGFVYAVDGVSFVLEEGKSLGLVGESGCGKTTAGLSILKLIQPTSGNIYFEGQDLFDLKKKAMKEVRRRMQIIFQDPYSSLNPKLKLKDIIREPLDIYNIHSKHMRDDLVAGLLDKVGLSVAFANRYPHELSGGQRQRIGIARALSIRPKLILADEPVSALDVSIQAQIINLIDDLRVEFNLSYIIISHDLSVVEHMCDQIAVMYLGRIVEKAPYNELFTSPRHPYTQALLEAIPTADPHLKKDLIILKGQVPNPMNPPAGCHFHPRCYQKIDGCEKQIPESKKIAENHYVACHQV